MPLATPVSLFSPRSLTTATLSIVIAMVSFSLAGCGLGSAASPAADPIIPAFSGKTFGGPNPIIGATIKLYVTSSSGYGTSTANGSNAWTQEATAQTNTPNYPNGDTDVNGAFSFAGGYTCPAGQFAYVVSSGGNTGASTPTVQATATATLTAGAVSAITVNTAGTGYYSATVSITSSDGNPPSTPATAVAVINPATGGIASIRVTASGAGYDATPTVTISSPSYYNAANNNAVLVAALGRCEDLYANTSGGAYTGNYIYINELSTVAAGYALGHFAAVSNGPGAGTIVQIGADATNNAPSGAACVANGTTCTTTQASGLLHAFQNAANLVNVFNYQSPASANTTTTAYTGQSGVIPVVPTQLINTIANIMVSCVNSSGGTASSGSSSDGTACGKLFQYTTPLGSSTPPTDTFSAVVNLAANPTVGGSGTAVSNLFNVAGAFTSVYSPALTASTNLNDYAIAITYPQTLGNSTATTFLPTCPGANATTLCQGIIYPVSGAIDINDNYYAGNQSTTGGTAPSDILSFSSNGTLLGESNNDANAKGCFGLSVDAIGNGYCANQGGSGTNVLAHFTYASGVPGATLATLTPSANGIDLKTNATAVDQANNVWVSGIINGGASTVYKSAAGGASFSAIAGPTVAQGVTAIAIDPNQNVWLDTTGTSVYVIQNTGSTAALGGTPSYSASSVLIGTATITPTVGITFAGTSASNYTAYVSAVGIEPFTFTLAGANNIEVTALTAGTKVVGNLAGSYYNQADGTGNIWIADQNSHSVQAFNPTLGTSYKIKPCANIASNTCSTIWSTLKPYNVAIDSAGDVWVPSPTITTGFIQEIIGAAAPTWPLLSLGKLGQP